MSREDGYEATLHEKPYLCVVERSIIGIVRHMETWFDAGTLAGHWDRRFWQIFRRNVLAQCSHCLDQMVPAEPIFPPSRELDSVAEGCTNVRSKTARNTHQFSSIWLSLSGAAVWR